MPDRTLDQILAEEQGNEYTPIPIEQEYLQRAQEYIQGGPEAIYRQRMESIFGGKTKKAKIIKGILGGLLEGGLGAFGQKTMSQRFQEQALDEYKAKAPFLTRDVLQNKQLDFQREKLKEDSRNKLADLVRKNKLTDAQVKKFEQDLDLNPQLAAARIDLMHSQASLNETKKEEGQITNEWLARFGVKQAPTDIASASWLTGGMDRFNTMTPEQRMGALANSSVGRGAAGILSKNPVSGQPARTTTVPRQYTEVLPDGRTITKYDYLPTFHQGTQRVNTGLQQTQDALRSIMGGSPSEVNTEKLETKPSATEKIKETFLPQAKSKVPKSQVSPVSSPTPPMTGHSKANEIEHVGFKTPKASLDNAQKENSAQAALDISKRVASSWQEFDKITGSLKGSGPVKTLRTKLTDISPLEAAITPGQTESVWNKVKEMSGLAVTTAEQAMARDVMGDLNPSLWQSGTRTPYLGYKIFAASLMNAALQTASHYNLDIGTREKLNIPGKVRDAALKYVDMLKNGGKLPPDAFDIYRLFPELRIMRDEGMSIRKKLDTKYGGKTQ